MALGMGLGGAEVHGGRKMSTFKKGGTKRGKGPAKLHRGEDIMPPKSKKAKRKGGRMGGRN